MTFKVKFVVYGCCLHKQTGFVTFRSLQNEGCRLHLVDVKCRPRVKSRPWTRCKMKTGCKMQSENKMQTADQGSNVDGSLQLF